MVLRVYLLLGLLLFVSCGELGNNPIYKKESELTAHIRNQGFSPRAETRLLAALSAFKTKEKYSFRTPEEREQRKISLRLEFNEMYEEEQYLLKLPKRNLSEVREKYQALRNINFKHSDSIPNIKVMDAVYDVYRDFGRLYVSETQFSQDMQASRVPWAGHWYPYSDSTLHDDENSPLGKLDQLIGKVKGTPGLVRKTHKLKSKGKGSTSWEGLCDARSYASVLTPEPQKPITVHGITFSIADLKGILTVAHSSYPYTQYGMTYRGNFKSDGGIMDIAPEAYQRVIEKVIGKRKQAVVVDEAQNQVWNSPMFGFSYTARQDPENENALLVSAYPRTVTYRDEESEVLTNRDDILIPSYEYRLYVNKKKKKKGKYLVLSSEWVGLSRFSHPDNIKVLHKNKGYSSYNQEILKNKDVLQLLY